jgi:hypothetical protein
LASIQIKGIDVHYQEFTEVINIRDDGIFITSFVFKEIREITREGFDGEVVVSVGPVDMPFEEDPFRVLVLDDMEGQLEIKLNTEEIVIEGTPTNVSFVTYQTNRFKLGRQYRQRGVSTIDNVEELGSFLLKDRNGEVYFAKSLAVSPANTYLYVLAEDGQVHIYDHGLPEFLPPQNSDTITNYIELDPISAYAKYKRTEYLWTRFQRLKYPLVSLEIKRIAPDTTIEYLQLDHSWSATQSKFVVNSVVPKFSDWVDFRFETTYEQTGTYEYIATAKTAVDQTVFSTQVYCGDMIAASTVVAAGGDTIFFADNGKLVIDDGVNAYAYEEHVDQYVIDENMSKLWLSDSYESLVVNSTEYESTTVLLPAGLDEFALKWSMARLPRETLEAFKLRFLLEYRDPVDNSFRQFRSSPGRQVGALDIPIAKITVVDDTLRYPRLKVTATKLYYWENSNEDPVVELDLIHRDSAYFLTNVISALQAVSSLSVQILDTNYQYRFSRQLKIEDTNLTGTSFLHENYVNNLGVSLLNTVQFSDTTVFKTERSTSEDVSEAGDYYIDYKNGIVISNELQVGFCLYTKSSFPLYLYWQPVRVIEFNDSDINLSIKDTVRTDNGLEHLLLNWQGTRYFNELLKTYPLEWGA